MNTKKQLMGWGVLALALTVLGASSAFANSDSVYSGASSIPSVTYREPQVNLVHTHSGPPRVTANATNTKAATSSVDSVYRVNSLIYEFPTRYMSASSSAAPSYTPPAPNYTPPSSGSSSGSGVASNSGSASKSPHPACISVVAGAGGGLVRGQGFVICKSGHYTVRGGKNQNASAPTQYSGYELPGSCTSHGCNFMVMTHCTSRGRATTCTLLKQPFIWKP